MQPDQEVIRKYQFNKSMQILLFCILFFITYILNMSSSVLRDMGVFPMYILVFSNVIMVLDALIIIIYNDDNFYRREVKIITPTMYWLNIAIKTPYFILLNLFFAYNRVPAYIFVVVYYGLSTIYLLVIYYKNRNINNTGQVYYFGL